MLEFICFDSHAAGKTCVLLLKYWKNIYKKGILSWNFESHLSGHPVLSAMDIMKNWLAPNCTKILNTWMKNNINYIVSRYFRLWLEIPVNGTLNIITQSKTQIRLGVILPSTRHNQCQLTFRNKPRKSSNHNIREIHK